MEELKQCKSNNETCIIRCIDESWRKGMSFENPGRHWGPPLGPFSSAIFPGMCFAISLCDGIQFQVNPMVEWTSAYGR
jgi:hypothetical protein